MDAFRISERKTPGGIFLDVNAETVFVSKYMNSAPEMYQNQQRESGRKKKSQE